MQIGIDIGGTKCAVILGEGDTIVRKVKFATTTAEETLANIFSAVAAQGECSAIGVSCGGPLDAERGVILSPPNLPGWNEIAIVRLLQERFHVPVGLQNDANACALAEWKYGAGRGAKNMIFLTFGTGMGAGLILNGQLYGGTNGMAGEVGHIRMRRQGPVGYGKAGSFEGFCSGGGIKRMGQAVAKKALQAGKPVSFCKNAAMLDTITAKSIAEHASRGDEAALRVYHACAQKLGEGLAILIDILNPETIVIGSIFERSTALLVDKMSEAIKQEALEASRAVCTIVPSGLGDSIGDYAALAVADNTERMRNL